MTNETVDRVLARLHQHVADIGDSEDLIGCDGNEMLAAVLERIAQFIENEKFDKDMRRKPMNDETHGASTAITLPKSGVVLPCVNVGDGATDYVVVLGPVRVGIGQHYERWEAWVGATKQDGDFDDLVEWLDSRVLALRSALTPPDARERIALVLRGWAKNDLSIDAERLSCADAVLAALGMAP